MLFSRLLPFGLLLSTLLLISAQTMAQTGTIRGTVYLKKAQDPALFTNVYLEGTTYGSTTDSDGLFSIPKIPVGNYNLLISAYGYDTLRTPVTVTPECLITKKLYIERNYDIKEVRLHFHHPKQ